MLEARGRGADGGDWVVQLLHDWVVQLLQQVNDLLEMEPTRPASAEELATMGVGVTTAV
jgi:hypothetical protein